MVEALIATRSASWGSGSRFRLLLLAVLVVGCDIAPASDTHGWNVELLNPRAAPSWGPVQVQFDRRLSPSSVGRNSVRLTSGPVSEFLFPSFDPVTNQLNLELTRPMLVGASYVVTLVDLVDLDGTALDEPLQLLLSPVASEPEPIPSPEVAEVLNVFAEHCASASCHGSAEPAAGLDLESSEGLARTAIGHPASQVASFNQLAPIAAAGLIDLPIVDAQGTSQSASRSYLVYKMLGDPHVLGEAMPPPGLGEPPSSDQIALVTNWIRHGAPLE